MAVGQIVEAEKLSGAAKYRNGHLLGLARLEANRGPRRDIEMHAERRRPVEVERPVGFEKMVMATDLNRTVAGIHDLDGRLQSTRIELDLSVIRDNFAWDDGVSLGLPFSRTDRIVNCHEFGA